MLFTTKSGTNEYDLHGKQMLFILVIQLEASLCCKENPGIPVILEK